MEFTCGICICPQAQSEVGQNQEGAVAHRGWWGDLGSVRAELGWTVQWGTVAGPGDKLSVA